MLLTVCVAVDSADDEPITVTKNQTIQNKTKAVIMTNGTYVPMTNDSGEAIPDGKVYSDEPLVCIKSKPSCGCNHGYHWHRTVFINYCPHCYRYGVLTNKHKWQSKYEQELTCSHCDSDYCGVCGKEKYSWSHYRLLKRSKGIVYTKKPKYV